MTKGTILAAAETMLPARSRKWPPLVLLAGESAFLQRLRSALASDGIAAHSGCDAFALVRDATPPFVLVCDGPSGPLERLRGSGILEVLHHIVLTKEDVDSLRERFPDAICLRMPTSIPAILLHILAGMDEVQAYAGLVRAYQQRLIDSE